MKKLVIKRTFNAPIGRIWAALTTPEILEKWWAPEGMSTSDISVVLKIGGLFRYCFVSSDNKRFWGRGEYQAINDPVYISYFDTFSDERGNSVPPSHYGMPGDEIIEALVEFKLNSHDNVTDMELVGDNYYDDVMTEEMKKGWNGMFDKLENLFIHE